MYDARLTCIKYIVPPIGMVVVPSGDRSSATTKTLLKFIKADPYIKVILNGPSLKPFKAFSLETILSHGCENVAYFIKSLEPNKSIKNKLSASGQKASAIYSILPDLKNPRWLIPAERRFSAKSMPRIISPTSLVSRSGLNLFIIFRWAGLGQLIFPYRMVVASSKESQTNYSKTKCANYLEVISQSLEFENRPGVIYTGSYGPLQKFTLELIDYDYRQLAYAKIGSDVHSRRSINKEHSALKSLKSISFSTIKFPSCLGIMELDRWGDLVILQSCLKGGLKVNGLSDVIICALSELFIKTTEPEEISLKDYISKLCAKLELVDGARISSKISKIRDKITKLLVELSLTSGSVFIPLGLSHGDFTRWNLMVDNKFLYIIDWEEIGIRPPGHDLFNFLVSENLLARKQQPKKAAIQFLKNTVGRNNSYCREYFRKIFGKNSPNIKVYIMLFLAEIIQYNLWHLELHQKMDFPAKKSLTEIISTAWIIAQNLDDTFRKI